jgi:nitrous oxidase accessory protein NosD
MAMKSRALQIALLASTAGCGVSPSLEMLSCTTKFDCASGEACEDGLCVKASDSPATSDAGIVFNGQDSGQPHPGPMDSGQADSGRTDSGAPDAGAPDTGTPPDAGFNPGCPSPISVDGFAGYCTINAAVTAAVAGSVISVPAGTYAETIDVTKAVTISGNGLAVIQGSGAGAPLRIRAIGVVIENFTVEAAAAWGIEASGTVTIRNVIVNGASGIGISIEDMSTDVTVTGCTINGVTAADPIWGDGIDVGPGAKGTIIDTTIRDAGYAGILVYQGQIVVSNTRIERAGFAACAADDRRCGFGIYNEESTATVNGGTVIEQSGAAGILVYNAQLDLDNSQVINNGAPNAAWGPGILIDGGDPVYIDNNNISGNKHEGVGCYSITDDATTCNNNTHTNNGVWTNCSTC